MNSNTFSKSFYLRTVGSKERKAELCAELECATEDDEVDDANWCFSDGSMSRNPWAQLHFQDIMHITASQSKISKIDSKGPIFIKKTSITIRPWEYYYEL